MGRITSLLLAATALIAASPAAAQTWRIASTGGTAPGRSVYFVDLSSIQRTGSTVIFTTSTIFEGITADRDWDRSVTKRKGDCTAKSSQILQNTFFDGGTEIDSSDEPGNMIVHGENSIMRGVLDAVCGDGTYDGAVVANPRVAATDWFSTH
jgi:hypothetical protein